MENYPLYYGRLSERCFFEGTHLLKFKRRKVCTELSNEGNIV